MHNSNKWYNYFFWFLIVIYSATRLAGISSIPSTLNPDEASIGYNAYLLLTTGSDEWGERWPLVLEAFGDQKVIGYTALVVPMIAVFGFSDLAVRLPVVIAGLGIVLITNQILKQWQFSSRARLLALALLIIQPFFVWYTRVAFEATVSWFFVLLMIWVFFTDQFLQSRRTALLLTAIGTIGSILTYNAPLMTIPLLVLLLPFWHEIKKNRDSQHRARQFWMSISIVAILCWGVLFASLQQLSAQKSQITIFGDHTIRSEYTAYRQRFTEQSLTQKILGNQYLFYGQKMVSNTALQFHPGFLMHNSPGHPWHALHQTGYLYASTWLVAMVGVAFATWKFASWKIKAFKMLKFQQPMEWRSLLFALMLISLVPVAISSNAPHATRSLLFFWVLTILGTEALVGLIRGIEKKQKSVKNMHLMTSLSSALVFLFLVYPSIQYFHSLFIEYPQSGIAQATFQPNYAETLRVLESEFSATDTTVAVVDTRGFQYILTAWYLQMPAEEFIQTVVRQQPDSINFRYGEHIGRYRFIMNKNDVINEKYVVYWEQSQFKWVVEKVQL